MKIWPIRTLYNLSNVWCNKNRTKHSSVLLMPWFDFHCIRRYVYHNEVTSFLKTQSHFFSCIFVSFFANLVFLYFCNRRLHEYNMTMQVHESRNALSTKSPSISAAKCSPKKFLSFGTFKLIPYLHKNLFTMNFPVPDVI